MDALRNEANFLEKNIRGARLVVIKGAGHFPNLEQPKRFNTIVQSWLKTQAASKD